MNVLEVTSKFKTQSKCIKHLESLKWPNGAFCPYCASSKSCAKTKENRYTCISCKSSYSVTVGTIFESSKLPLPKWFLAIVLIKDSKKGVSSLQLARHLGVNKNTAWFLQHRIRKAMNESLELDGIVEIDETYVGGSVSNMHQSYVKKKNIYPGGMAHKTPVLGMIQRQGKIILKVLPKANKENIRPFLSSRIGSASTLVTDGLGVYRTLDKEFNKHVSINHEKKQKSKGKYNLSSIEGFWAMLKRAVTGIYHTITVKHLQSYMDELAFKFNHKFDECIFTTLISRMVDREIAVI